MQPFKIYLIGTSFEENQKNFVSNIRVDEFIKTNNVDLFFKTSSKTGYNVENAFVTILKHIYFCDEKEKK